MSKIKNTRQFKEQVDAAFATMQTRDEAKPDLKAEGRLKAATRRLNPPYMEGRVSLHGGSCLPTWRVVSPYMEGLTSLHGKTTFPSRV